MDVDQTETKETKSEENTTPQTTLVKPSDNQDVITPEETCANGDGAAQELEKIGEEKTTPGLNSEDLEEKTQKEEGEKTQKEDEQAVKAETVENLEKPVEQSSNYNSSDVTAVENNCENSSDIDSNNLSIDSCQDTVILLEAGDTNNTSSSGVSTVINNSEEAVKTCSASVVAGEEELTSKDRCENLNQTVEVEKQRESLPEPIIKVSSGGENSSEQAVQEVEQPASDIPQVEPSVQNTSTEIRRNPGSDTASVSEKEGGSTGPIEPSNLNTEQDKNKAKKKKVPTATLR